MSHVLIQITTNHKLAGFLFFFLFFPSISKITELDFGIKIAFNLDNEGNRQPQLPVKCRGLAAWQNHIK